VRRPPPLHRLQALEAVARLGSVVAAADELCDPADLARPEVRTFVEWLQRVVRSPAGPAEPASAAG
jgi:hypothetical protein